MGKRQKEIFNITVERNHLWLRALRLTHYIAMFIPKQVRWCKMLFMMQMEMS